jgi:hypothetical protein
VSANLEPRTLLIASSVAECRSGTLSCVLGRWRGICEVNF